MVLDGRGNATPPSRRSAARAPEALGRRGRRSDRRLGRGRVRLGHRSRGRCRPLGDRPPGPPAARARLGAVRARSGASDLARRTRAALLVGSRERAVSRAARVRAGPERPPVRARPPRRRHVAPRRAPRRRADRPARRAPRPPARGARALHGGGGRHARGQPGGRTSRSTSGSRRRSEAPTSTASSAWSSSSTTGRPRSPGSTPTARTALADHDLTGTARAHRRRGPRAPREAGGRSALRRGGHLPRHDGERLRERGHAARSTTSSGSRRTRSRPSG